MIKRLVIITRSPLRLSIGGGGTDLPFYYKKEKGFLITATMNKYVYCIVKKRFEEEIRLSYSENEEVGQIQDLKNDRARQILEENNFQKHLEVSTLADAPSGSGLGSSGVFTVGLLNAVKNFQGENWEDKELAEKAFDIEHNKLGYPCGKQDQYAAAFGGLIVLEINRNGETSVRPLNIDKSTIRTLEENLQLFYTGQLRDSSEVLEAQKKQVLSEDRKMKKMRKIKSIGKEIKEELEKGNTDSFGHLLHKHWRTKKEFTSKMSNSEIDNAYSKAREEGALGGKIMGAGGGGFFIFYVNQDRKEFRKEMEEIGLRHMDFKFDREGTKVINE